MRRPVMVIQTNVFNESRISTVIVAGITSNLSLAEAPGNVRLRESRVRPSKASVVNVSQVLTIDKTLLTQKVKALPGAFMQRVDAGLKLVLAL